ncbi:MAG: hypothetical protein HXX10_14485 [Rhodoplanes sp.]|uniref:O-antigen ligase family protein n=1 Tax=Rhodoplanes sp. TaxID=1968906 RepID=UPI0018078D4B|nr:hypothetical protein [Rhodoplanes sp.]NVO15239.1 hypothetical protein [Rhodoplanes sp.]
MIRLPWLSSFRAKVQTWYPHFGAFMAWLALLMLVSPRQIHNTTFYVFLLVPFVLALTGDDVRSLASSWVIRLTALWLVVLWMSPAWTPPIDLSTWATLGRFGASNFLLLLLAVWLFAADPRRIGTMFLWLGVVGAGIGAVSVVQYFSVPADGTRFIIGHWNVNVGAGILGLITVGLVCGPATNWSMRRRAFASVALAVVLSFFVVLTASRAPVLAAVVSILFAAATGGSRRIVGATVLLASALTLLAYASGVIDLGNWLARADAKRFDIWEFYGRLALEHVMVGHGIDQEFKFVVPELRLDTPHNMFLGNLLYGGLASVVAYVLLMGTSVWVGIDRVRRSGDLLPLALTLYLFLHGQFESSLPFHGADWRWMYYWLPLAAAATAELALRASPPAGGTTRIVVSACPPNNRPSKK